MKNLGLYLHIPFCMKKCLYCDFLSFADVSAAIQNDYINMLIREVVSKGKLYRKDYFVDTIFIGGGTPSLIEEALIVDLMSAIKVNFNVMEDAEITIESNPGTLSKDKLEAYIGAGINRLSMGAQSMDDHCLKLMGRIHHAEDLVDNFKLARAVGFKNINIDLMFAIPEQSIEIWQETLKKTIALQPEHISFYSLQIEEETPYFEMFKTGELNQTVDEVDRNMYHMGIEMLKEAGYSHYEISNAAKPGYECRHNLKYWSFADYLGLGLGAHSFIRNNERDNNWADATSRKNSICETNDARFSNTKNLESYMEKCRTGQSVEDWQHTNTQKDSISEYIFTGLRKTRGINLREFEEIFGVSIEEYYKEQWLNIKRFICDKYLFMDNDKLMLTEKGIDVSNKILVEFV
ncbi:MAG: radical SAM family heme chaperone HemW [Peptostreptococcaceae bacterium]|nr:radical SAM family heme chaperone HemW [Peptostreptococcaceae bacterium]